MCKDFTNAHELEFKLRILKPYFSRYEGLTGKTNRNDMSREIKDKVCDGLEYLYGRADFWRQQKPMYARKRDKQRQEDNWKKSGRGGSRNAMEKVLVNLEKIEECKNAMMFCL